MNRLLVVIVIITIIVSLILPNISLAEEDEITVEMDFGEEDIDGSMTPVDINPSGGEYVNYEDIIPNDEGKEGQEDSVVEEEGQEDSVVEEEGQDETLDANIDWGEDEEDETGVIAEHLEGEEYEEEGDPSVNDIPDLIVDTNNNGEPMISEQENAEETVKEGKSESSNKKTENRRSIIIVPSQNTKNTLIGDWVMIEARKIDFDDVIRFPITIVSIDNEGNVDLYWGDSGRINGKWDEYRQVLTVFSSQKYVLHDGVLGGANRHYSGVALKRGSVSEVINDSILGKWQMTEYRKDVNNDIIQFDVEVLSINDDGSAVLKWSEAEITGKWDSIKRTLTVYDQQVYVFCYGVLGGGNETYSGIALRKAY